MRHRHRIFGIMKSTEFLMEHPEMRKVAKLGISDMKKAILMMFIYGYTAATISKVLSSTPQSIMTLISELRGPSWGRLRFSRGISYKSY